LVIPPPVAVSVMVLEFAGVLADAVKTIFIALPPVP
jgi:hypothetical protein